MRVALVSGQATPLAGPGDPSCGSQNIHVAALADELAAQGHQIRIYTRRDRTELPERTTADSGVTVVHVPAGPPRTVAEDDLLPLVGDFGRWLAAEWSRWTPEVAHAHFWSSGLATLTAVNRLATPVPVVQTFHTLGVGKHRHERSADTPSATRIGYERILGQQVDRVVAQCSDEVAELLAMGVRRTRVSLIPPGVDTVRFTPRGPAAERSGNLRRLLVVGRFAEHNGALDVVRALPRIPDSEAVLVAAGVTGSMSRDPVAGQLVRVADQLGVADRFRLVGAAAPEDLPGWYRSADVVVCPAWYEPSGLTALEAMACAVPVVAYAVGGYQDTVVDGVTGQLVRPRDVRALGDTLRHLLADPYRRMQYGAAGLDRAHRSYPWSRTARQLLAIYEQVGREPQRLTAPAQG